MKRLLTLCGMLLALPALANWWTRIPSHEGYRRLMQSWLDASADDLVRSWGPPQSTYTMTDGHVLYLYRKETVHSSAGKTTTTVDPQTRTRTTTREPPSEWVSHCESQFEIADNRVVRWRYEGSDCTAGYDDDEAKPAPTRPPARAVLGATLNEMTDEAAKRLQLDERRGVQVLAVKPSGAAERAGLKVDDVIAIVDGKDVSLVKQVQELIGKHRPGDAVSLGIIREQHLKYLTATLGSP